MILPALIPFIKKKIIWNTVFHVQNHDIVVDITREWRSKNKIKYTLIGHVRLYHEKNNHLQEKNLHFQSCIIFLNKKSKISLKALNSQAYHLAPKLSLPLPPLLEALWILTNFSWAFAPPMIRDCWPKN